MNVRNVGMVLLALLAGGLGRAAEARVLTVGAAGAYALPSQAATAARDGDVIEIAAGDYPGDVATWRASNLTIRGVGGFAHLDAAGKSAGGKAIWVITGANTTIEHLEFSGCHVPDKNGAGIRQEGAGLTLRHCWFHDNEDGILTGANPQSDIRIEYSEFGHNGHGDGYSHNMYIGKVRSFMLLGCYSHHANVGHLVKSRAETNYLLYNRLTDEADGNSSYVIDLPWGGKSFVIGNIIQHGPRAENGMAVSYAAEGAQNAVQALYVVNNTFINERHAGGFLRVQGTPALKLVNNLFTGSAGVLAAAAAFPLPDNLVTSAPGFTDAAHYDYTLTDASPARNTGIDPGAVDGYALPALFIYQHPAATAPRPPAAHPNMGAF